MTARPGRGKKRRSRSELQRSGACARLRRRRKKDRRGGWHVAHHRIIGPSTEQGDLKAAGRERAPPIFCSGKLSGAFLTLSQGACSRFHTRKAGPQDRRMAGTFSGLAQRRFRGSQEKTCPKQCHQKPPGKKKTQWTLS